MSKMIRDDIAVTRAVIATAYKLSTAKDWRDTDKYTIGYRQGVFDLAGQLLWPDEDWNTQRDRLHRLFTAHRALFDAESAS